MGVVLELVLLTATLVGLLLAGCGTEPIEVETEPVVAAHTEAEGDEVLDEPEPEPQPTPVVRPPIDPATITGYVRGMAAPDEPRGSGQIAAVQLVVNQHVPSASDLRFEIRDGAHVRRFHVVVPNDFPHPLVEGEAVTYVAGFSGGGPNGRATMMIRAADGMLLFAVDTLPDGWTVESGRRVSSEDLDTYREHHHAVAFAIAGVRTVVQPGDWGTIATPDGEMLVWGAAANRQLRPGRPAPPDYVGEWLDFAIVRVR